MYYKLLITIHVTVWSCLILMLVCILWLNVVFLKAEPNPDTVAGLRLKDCNFVQPHKSSDWNLSTGCMWLVPFSEYLQRMDPHVTQSGTLNLECQDAAFIDFFFPSLYIKLLIHHPFWLALLNLHNPTASCLSTLKKAWWKIVHFLCWVLV